MKDYRTQVYNRIYTLASAQQPSAIAGTVPGRLVEENERFLGSHVITQQSTSIDCHEIGKEAFDWFRSNAC